jgi:hypothetical protein
MTPQYFRVFWSFKPNNPTTKIISIVEFETPFAEF